MLLRGAVLCEGLGSGWGRPLQLHRHRDAHPLSVQKPDGERSGLALPVGPGKQIEGPGPIGVVLHRQGIGRTLRPGRVQVPPRSMASPAVRVSSRRSRRVPRPGSVYRIPPSARLRYFAPHRGGGRAHIPGESRRTGPALSLAAPGGPARPRTGPAVEGRSCPAPSIFRSNVP